MSAHVSMRLALPFAFILLGVAGLSMPFAPNQSEAARTAIPFAQHADWPEVTTDHVREVLINLTA